MRLILLCFLLFIPLLSQAAEAPFGLSWYMTEKQVKELGFVKNKNSYISTRIKTGFREQMGVILSFHGYDYGLQKFQWVSTNKLDNSFGEIEERIRLYFDIKNQLSSLYGRHTHELEYMSKQATTDPANPSVCLADNGRCSQYLSVWNLEDMVIRLSIEKGRVVINFYGPKWFKGGK